MLLKRFVKAGSVLSVSAAVCLFWGCADIVGESEAFFEPPSVFLPEEEPVVQQADAAALAFQVGCSREGLEAAVNSYLAALAAGDHTLMPLTESARYVENDSRTVTFGQGLWQAPIIPDFHLNLLDVDECATFTEVIVANTTPQYILGVRLQVEADNSTSVLHPPRMLRSASAGGRISEVYVVATWQGHWLFNANNFLLYSQREDWSELPENQRITREELRAGAQAYFDYFGDKTVDVPWGIPCARLEGGAYTGDRPTSSCNIGIPDVAAPIRHTRPYLVDVNHGMVVLFVFFGGPDTHLFRILPTGYRYIHTLTAMLQSDFQP